MFSVFAGKLPKITKEEVEQQIEEISQKLGESFDLMNSKILGASGNGISKLFFLGEAAGPNDANNGQIFSGPYSQIFNNELLPSVGLDREQIYLTNLVKNSQPFGHTPNQEQINIWRQVVLSEIALIQPRLIVTLGRFALEFFLPRSKISNLRGQLFQLKLFEDFQTTVLFLTHPANAHRFPEQKAGIVKDFGQIKLFLENKIQAQEIPAVFLAQNNKTQSLF